MNSTRLPLGTVCSCCGEFVDSGDRHYCKRIIVKSPRRVFKELEDWDADGDWSNAVRIVEDAGDSHD